MDGSYATLWICCGAGTGAAGLYALMIAAARDPVSSQHRVPQNRVLRGIGWGACCAGGGVIAGAVLQSTGSFWSLLVFCGLAATALLSATIVAVPRPQFRSTDDTESDAGVPSGDLRWGLVTIAAVAGILVWHGVYWCGGLLLASVAVLGTARWWLPRSLRRPSAETAAGFREPALASVMWGMVTWGLMTALWNHQTADGRLNNALAVACGLLPLGALQTANRTHVRGRVMGLGTLMLATLTCLAGGDRAHAEPLGLTVLACSAVSIGLILRAAPPLSTAAER